MRECLTFPTHDLKTDLGLSEPAKPAFKIPLNLRYNKVNLTKSNGNLFK